MIAKTGEDKWPDMLNCYKYKTTSPNDHFHGGTLVILGPEEQSRLEPGLFSQLQICSGWEYIVCLFPTLDYFVFKHVKKKKTFLNTFLEPL